MPHDRLTAAARKQRTKIAAAVKRGDAAAAEEARCKFKAMKAEDYIRQLVESGPELSTEVRDRLALLLRPTA